MNWIKQLVIIFLRIVKFILTWVRVLFLPVKYDSTWQLLGRPLIYKRRQSRLLIGRRFKACSLPRNNTIGVFQKVYIKTCNPGSEILIGDDVGMSGCVVSAHKSIRIGNRVLIGSGALITDSDAHPLDPEERKTKKDGASIPIVIEDDVFVGARAIILKGVTIGRGSVIGAGAVVTKDVPPFSIAAGNPARVIGDSRRS